MREEYAKELRPDPAAAEAEYIRLGTLLFEMTDKELQSDPADVIREAMEAPYYAMDWDRHKIAETIAWDRAAERLVGTYRTSQVNYAGRPVPLHFTE